jgi:hypothetical protein
MNKKIITLFLITISTISHGMEKMCDDTNAPEILLCITKHLCPMDIIGKTTKDKYLSFSNNLDTLGKNINKLGRTNKFFNTHYSNEKTAQAITRCIASHGLDNEICISHYLGKYNNHFITVRDKIRELHKIASNPNRQFSKEDLNDSWYVNATQSPESNTALWCAYFIFQPQKIEILLNAKANVRYSRNNNILNSIARGRFKCLQSPIVPLDIEHSKMYLAIARQLLEHGADPDFRLINDPTPLMIAVCGNDKEYAHVLLWHHANPHKKGTWINNSVKNSFEVKKACNEKNAFEMEPTGWLQQMVDERENIIANCLLFKHWKTHEGDTLLPELTQLITYTAWHIGKTYNEKEKTT